MRRDKLLHSLKYMLANPYRHYDAADTIYHKSVAAFNLGIFLPIA